MRNNVWERLEDKSANVSVIGQGYVGLPLALGISRAGFRVHGIDVDQRTVSELANGKSHIQDVDDSQVEGAIESGMFLPTSDFAVLVESDVVVICVPTPLRKTRDPDISHVLDAVSEIGRRLHSGMLIVLESTTYPGTSEELIVPEVERLGFQVGKDVFICFSPERIDPGNSVYGINNTPKVVGGITPECTRLGTLFYSQFVTRVVPVSSARVAETVKLLENTFRSVNIALVNEMAMMCERMSIDVWEVIRAAATKPFGFMTFYPGPGTGGHCIPLDPVYLSWKAKSYGFYNRFIDLASDINGNMPRHVVTKVAEALNSRRKPVLGSSILILGMAYKKDTNDMRESPSLELYRLLRAQGAHVDFHDPYIEYFMEGSVRHSSVSLTPTVLSGYDCILLATDHSVYDYRMIAEFGRLVVDTRNAFKDEWLPNVVRLGSPTTSVLQEDSV